MKTPAILAAALLAFCAPPSPAQPVGATPARAEGDRGGAGLDDLLRQLHDEDPELRAHAARAIGEMGPDAAAAVPDLAEMLAGAGMPAQPSGHARARESWDPAEEPASVAFALSRLGPGGQAALVAMLENSSLARRYWGAVGIAESRPGEGQGADQLLRAVDRSQDERLRGAAAAALGVVRDPPPGVGEILAKMLDDPSVRVRAGAARALGRLHAGVPGMAPGVEDRLLSLLQSAAGHTRSEAADGAAREYAGALCRMDPAGTSALAGAIGRMNQAGRMLVLGAVGDVFGQGECGRGLGEVAKALASCDDFVVAGHAAKLKGKICSACLNGCIGEVEPEVTSRVLLLAGVMDRIRTEKDWEGRERLEAWKEDPAAWPAPEQRALAEECVSRLHSRHGVQRRVCVVLLARVPHHAAPAVEDLTEVVRTSEDQEELRAAVPTLGVIGAPAARALPILRAMKSREGEIGRLAALAAALIDQDLEKAAKSTRPGG